MLKELDRILGVARLLLADPWRPAYGTSRVRPGNLGGSNETELRFVGSPPGPRAPLYRAPEAHDLIDRTVDARAEIYSLGVFAYERLAGTPPFVESDPVALAHAHLAVLPAPLVSVAAVPAGLADVVQRMLAKEPDDRYASIEGLLHDLEQARATLAATGDVPRFPLGEADVPRRLRPVVGSFARDELLHPLRTALDRVREGASGRVVLHGDVGCGMVDVAEAFGHRAARDGTPVGVGRFDRLSARPLAPWMRALRGLLAALPSASAATRALHTERLGPLAPALAHSLPALARHVDALAPVDADVGGADPDRLARGIQALLRSLATENPGLLVVLCDVNVAPAPSAALLHTIRAEPVPGLLLVEAHSGIAVDSGDALVLRVAPFEPHQTVAWVAHTTKTPPEVVQDLAEALHVRSGGRPHVVAELLLDWRQRDLIRWTPRGWVAEPAIHDQPAHADTAELLVHALQRLPPDHHDVLVVAAHLEVVDAEVLRAVCGDLADDALDGAVSEGVLWVRGDGRFQWTHDRLRSSLVDPDAAPTVHRHIAQACADLPDESRTALASHALHGGLTDATWAPVHRRAAMSCLQRLQWTDAAAFARAALLDESDDVDLYMVQARAAFHTADEATLLGALERIRTLRPRSVDRVDAELLHIQADLAATRWGPATDRALHTLRDLGIHLPRRPGKAQVALELARTMRALGGIPPAQLATGPLSEEPRDHHIDRLLLWGATAAYFDAPDLVPVCGMRMACLARERGVTPHTAFGLALMALVEAGVLERFPTSMAWADAADALLERLPNPSLEGKVGLVVDGFVRGWSVPLQRQIRAVTTRRARALAAGDETFAVYCGATAVYNAFASGVPLSRMADSLDPIAHHARDSRQDQAWPMFAAWRQLHVCLEEGTSRLEGSWFDWTERRPVYEAAGDGNSLGHAGTAAGVLAYATGRPEEAAIHLDTAWRALDGIIGQCVVAVQRAFSGLTHAALAQQSSGFQRLRHLSRARYDRARLVRLARSNEADLGAWLRLLDAEILGARGARLEGLAAMDEARRWAQDHGRDGDVALIEQRAAVACERCGLHQAAEERRRAAAAAWRRYGAPGMAQEVDADPLPELDVLAMVRGMRLIGAQEDEAGLTEKLLTAIVEGTAAERALLYRREGRTWRVVGVAGTDEAPHPDTLVAEAASEARPLGIEEARRLDLLHQDDLQGAEVRSLWAHPIVRGGRVDDVLYVDTRHMEGALGPAAQRFVGVLGTQAGIVRAHLRSVAALRRAMDQSQTAHAALRQTHAQLRASTISTARLEGILAGLTDGVVVLDARGEVDRINSAARTWLGAEPDPAEVLALCDARHPWLTTPQGHRMPVRAVRAPLHDDDGGPAGEVVLLSDMSERHRAEEALRRARADAEEASRAKSHFLASMSHELRTPLNAIIGYADLLLDEADGQLASDLGRIRGAGVHLLALINDVLDLSKVEADKLEVQLRPVSVDELLQPVREQARVLMATNDNHFHTDVPPDVPRIRCDLMRTRQVLLNLLSNAAKFTEQGLVELQVRRRHDEVVFTVRDSGIGMDDRALQTVFQPFQQADASIAARFGGTGLGLALSDKLAQQMNGSLHATSRLGEGSTFTLTLPVATTPLPVRDRTPTPPPG